MTAEQAIDRRIRRREMERVVKLDSSACREARGMFPRPSLKYKQGQGRQVRATVHDVQIVKTKIRSLGVLLLIGKASLINLRQRVNMRR